MPQERKKSSRFPDTRWSLVGRAGASNDFIRQKALSELVTAYMPGLRAFLIEARRIPADLADDLLQGFVADRVLSAGLVSRAEESRGKFRNFVMRSLSNYAITKLQGEYATRARRVGFDEELVMLSNDRQVIDRFDQEWVQQVVRDALRLMEQDCVQRDRSDLWEVFRLRVVDPMLQGVDPVDYEQIVKRFAIETPRQAINLLANAKRSFSNHLRAAVGKYAAGKEAIEAEIVDLRKIIDR